MASFVFVIGGLLFVGYGAELRFRWQVQRMAGTAATDCGYVPLGDDPAASVACVQDAVEKGEPFWAVFAHHGVDSAVASAIVGDSEDGITLLNYDSYPRVGIGRLMYAPRITPKQCGRLAIAADKPASGYPYWNIEIVCK